MATAIRRTSMAMAMPTRNAFAALRAYYFSQSGRRPALSLATVLVSSTGSNNNSFSTTTTTTTRPRIIYDGVADNTRVSGLGAYCSYSTASGQKDGLARRIFAKAGVDSTSVLRGFYDPQPQNEALEKYRNVLTELARRGELKPVLGQDDEIQRCIQILSQEANNNPIIIGGDPMERTAVVEGLAQRIVCGDVPETLINRELISVHVGSLLAGTKFPGDFEESLKAVLKEVSASNGKIILFIDDIHNVVGAGANSGGATDAGNLLKSMIWRGEVQCIGATTLKGYKKYIKKDHALQLRFQRIFNEQPFAVLVMCLFVDVALGIIGI